MYTQTTTTTTYGGPIIANMGLGAMPNFHRDSFAAHAMSAARDLMPFAGRMGGFIPTAALQQMAYSRESNYNTPNRKSSQFLLSQPGLMGLMLKDTMRQFGGRNWGAYGQPGCSAQSLQNLANGGYCDRMPKGWSAMPMAGFAMSTQTSQLDFNSCARTLNTVLNGSKFGSGIGVQGLVNMANGKDPVKAEAARAFLQNPEWMQRITGGDGMISRAELNRATMSPQNSADARTVVNHMKSLGMRVMPSDAVMRGQANNLNLPPHIRSAYSRLMEGGEYSAYRALEQFDVAKQPDGCSDISNFEQAASYHGM